MALEDPALRARDGLEACLKHPDGRFFLGNLLRMTGLFSYGPAPGEAIATYLGRRAVGVALIHRMDEIDRTLFPDLQREMREYGRAIEDDRNRHRDEDDGDDRDEGPSWNDRGVDF